MRVNVRAALLQLGGGLVERVLAQIGDHHLASRLGKYFGLAKPAPLAPPVMNATLPAKSCIAISQILFSRLPRDLPQ